VVNEIHHRGTKNTSVAQRKAKPGHLTLLLTRAPADQSDIRVIAPEGVVVRSSQLDNISGQMVEVHEVRRVGPEFVIEKLVIGRVQYPDGFG